MFLSLFICLYLCLELWLNSVYNHGRPTRWTVFSLGLFIFVFFGVIIPDSQLPKFTESTHKMHKIAYKMSKKGVLEGVAERGEDVRMGDRAP